MGPSFRLQLNTIESHSYLMSTLQLIAAGHPENRIDELLPWSLQPSNKNPLWGPSEHFHS